MDQVETQYLFKETRLSLEPPSSSTVVTVRVPSSNGSRSNGRKQNGDASLEDETTFRHKNLAAASSIYHRKHHDSPRSFLWRTLEDGTLLSIRSVDVCNKDANAEAPKILHFRFTTPIQPGCVALADAKEHDSLSVFVLDQSYQLFTFTLRPDLFRKRTAVDASLPDIGKSFAPTGLGFKHPHRMVAVSTKMLLLTVNDGGIIRLDKNRTDQSSAPLWKETFFNVQGWAQNLRSMLPFQGKHTIRYKKVNMEYSAATSVEVTDFGLENHLFAVTVCVDHRLRIWNIQDGQIVYTCDLLDAERTPQEVGKWSIDPAQSNLVRIVGRTRASRICVTYSPIGAGEFKFWKITAKDGHTIEVDDMFKNLSLVPPTPSSDVWTLADFVVANPAESEMTLWTLWKNNITYRVQKLDLDKKNMGETWDRNWDGVYAETNIIDVQTSGACDSTDVTEKWLETILQPGRFTKQTLNTALSIYEQGLGVARENVRTKGLAESICTVLGSAATLNRGSSGAMDYEAFRSSSESQWRRFYRLLVELDRLRGEALGLALDPEADMIWVVCTDLVSAVRECSSLERLYHNISSPDEDQLQQASLVNVALSFVEGFSDSFIQVCNAVLRSELFEVSNKTDLERIQYFSDKSGFWRGVTDEDCSQIVDTLGQNFSMVTDSLYRQVLDLIAAPEDAKRRKLKHPLSDFGNKLIMKTVQDSLELQWKVCFSQLILLVHMEFEFDEEQDALHNRVDIFSVYRQLIGALRRLELLRWLAKTEVEVPIGKGTKSGLGQGKRSGTETQVVTALEANVGHLLGFDNVTDEPLAVSITDLVANLCAPDSDIEISTTSIQCSLIRRERADLALDLSPFCDQNPFSTYVQGRVLLALKDFAGAAILFRKAAIGMGSEKGKMELHSSGLLDETELHLLNAGLAKYYSHIVALYERYRVYSYVVEFARLAVPFLGPSSDSSLTKTDMLSRLFNAAVATSQFQLAHTSLLSFKDGALRHSSLRKLIDKMCDTCHNPELVALPFPGMQQDVDDILADKCRSAFDVVDGVPVHQVLYSWRIRHSNFRGAASVLLDRIHKLQLAGEGDNILGDDVLDTPVTKQYLLLINALSCVDTKQAWIYDEGVAVKGEAPAKRKVVSLADIRKQYQDELDRIAAIQNNQFGFEAGDAMEIA